MTTQFLALVTDTKLCSASDVAAIAAALQVQLNRDLLLAWNLAPVEVNIFSTDEDLPPDAFSILLTDTAPTEAGVLGDHWEDAGKVQGQIFCSTIVNAKAGILTGPWSVAVTTSHEACEQLCDPSASQYCPRSLNSDSIAKEVCDPVEGLTYTIDGVDVADFVTPYYFDDSATVGRPLDFLKTGNLTPFGLAPSGYYVKRAADGTTSQIFGIKPPPAWWLAARGRAQRRVKRGTWLKSTKLVGASGSTK